jgi:sulfur carrier protein ThiS
MATNETRFLNVDARCSRSLLHHKKRREKGELKYHELLEIININAHGGASEVENSTVSHHEQQHEL